MPGLREAFTVLHRVRKKVYGILGITSLNIIRFSKLFHSHLLETCNKAIIKYPTTPQKRGYTIPYEKLIVRKLECPVRRNAVTRKLCYCKDDRAMRPIYGCTENFRDSLTTPTSTFPKIFHGLLF